MLNRLCFALVSLFIFSNAYASPDAVEKLWQLEGFNNPESVVYDATQDRLYVSNVNGDAMDKDGNGTISIVSLDGKMIQPDWVAGLNAPKGLVLFNDTLYVTDIDALVAINTRDGTIKNRYEVVDAKFLNDVTADPDGNIYVSDMMMNRIHILKDGEFSIWIESDALENPNGLHFEEDDIILGSWGKMTDGFATDVPGHLKRISIKDKEISSVGDGSPVGNLDGVEGTEETGFYVTDWMNGKLFHISRKGVVTTLLELNQGSADHEYIIDQNLILLPMMKDNVLNAYQIK